MSQCYFGAMKRPLEWMERVDRFSDWVAKKSQETGWSLMLEDKVEATFYYTSKPGAAAVLVTASIDDYGRIEVTQR